MVGGFVKGMLGTLLWLAGMFLLAVWLFSGFYSASAFFWGVSLLLAGAFLSYVSRQTVLPARVMPLAQNTSTEHRVACPNCAERILPAARICPFCKEKTGF